MGVWDASAGEPAVGYWSPQTSAVNFCEEDYAVSHYVAEFFNTLTSLLYILYAVHGIRRHRGQHTKLFSIVNLPYWGLICVGVCSGVYHTTLKYHTQMADEMSMHTAMGCVLIQVFTFEKSPATQRQITSVVLVSLTAFIIYHCATDEFLMHIILFLSLSITVITKTYLMIRDRVKDKLQKDKLATLATLGTVLAGLAYLLWNIDMHFCTTLTQWKRQVGMPLAILLEFHGWWHALTAVAVYVFMALIEFLTRPQPQHDRGFGFAWPAKTVLEEMATARVANKPYSVK